MLTGVAVGFGVGVGEVGGFGGFPRLHSLGLTRPNLSANFFSSSVTGNPRSQIASRTLCIRSNSARFAGVSGCRCPHVAILWIASLLIVFQHTLSHAKACAMPVMIIANANTVFIILSVLLLFVKYPALIAGLVFMIFYPCVMLPTHCHPCSCIKKVFPSCHFMMDLIGLLMAFWNLAICPKP